MAEYALSRDGKPVQLNEYVTVMGQVSAVSGSGSNATLTVKLAGSGNSVSVKSQDVVSSQGVIPTTAIA